MGHLQHSHLIQHCSICSALEQPEWLVHEQGPRIGDLYMLRSLGELLNLIREGHWSVGWSESAHCDCSLAHLIRHPKVCQLNRKSRSAPDGQSRPENSDKLADELNVKGHAHFKYLNVRTEHSMEQERKKKLHPHLAKLFPSTIVNI